MRCAVSASRSECLVTARSSLAALLWDLANAWGKWPNPDEGGLMMKLSWLTAAVTASMLAIAMPATAQDDEDPDALLAASHPVQIEFVQTAGGLTFTDGTLTLTNPSNLTIFFADRPRRFTGHLRNTDFSDYWTAASDGFAADPPNAAVVIGDSPEPPVIVELQSFALADDGALTYSVRVLEGELPASASDVALFIDPVAYVGPRVAFAAGPRGAAAVVRPRPVYRPIVVHPRGAVVVRPRCHASPYYYHDVCRLY